MGAKCLDEELEETGGALLGQVVRMRTCTGRGNTAPGSPSKVPLVQPPLVDKHFFPAMLFCVYTALRILSDSLISSLRITAVSRPQSHPCPSAMSF
jgi:hypothetical protein